VGDDEGAPLILVLSHVGEAELVRLAGAAGGRAGQVPRGVRVGEVRPVPGHQAPHVAQMIHAVARRTGPQVSTDRSWPKPSPNRPMVSSSTLPFDQIVWMRWMSTLENGRSLYTGFRVQSRFGERDVRRRVSPGVRKLSVWVISLGD